MGNIPNRRGRVNLAKNDCRWVAAHEQGPSCLLRALATCEYEADSEKCPYQEFKPFDPAATICMNEMYPAISGEGASAGQVCTIVRTTGCNLRCNFCDTIYAYEGGEDVPVKDVLDGVLKFGIKVVLFTGGEPLLNTEGASSFLRAMLEHEIVTYVETNGSIDIRPFKLLAHMVMDVKTPSSGMHDKMYWDNMTYIGPTDEVKFVVADEADYNYAKEIITKYNLALITPNIFISPVWSEDPKLSQNLSNWMIRDRSPARLMLQLHKCIWGATERGV